MLSCLADTDTLLVKGGYYSVDWTTGLEHWTGLLDWNTGLDYWTDIFLVFAHSMVGFTESC